MKKIFLSLLILNSCFLIFSQTAKAAAEEAARKDSLDQAVSYLTKTIPSMQSDSDKRALLAFLGSVQEQMGKYNDAFNSYAKAAAIRASDVAGMPKKSSEQLVIDAVRCCLSEGDWNQAQTYLNSSVRSSTDPVISAYVKLYEQWSILCKAGTIEETKEAVAMLKTYSGLSSMKAVHPQILLTLWHITGENSYSESLKKSYPKTPECAIVKGEIQTLPAPFWFFVPRTSTASPEVEAAETKVSAAATSTAVASGNAGTSAPSAAQKEAAEAAAKAEKESKAPVEKTETETKADKITRQQLGLFREKANAEGLIERLKGKGFNAHIVSEVRPSGTTYFIVVVDENKEGNMGDQLRTAGFECYPVFE